MTCINLGSGQRKFHSTDDVTWINVDINEKWQPDVVADGAHMPMFADDSVDVIVSHHQCEHLPCGGADGMLRECYRILRPSGSLIVCVPDALELAKAYASGAITDYIFAVQMMGAFMDSEADRHKWTYSYTSLSQTIKQAGQWSSIKRFTWREIPGADIARDWYICGVEAVK